MADVQTKHVAAIKQLSFRQAKRIYGIGYETWKGIKAGKRDLWDPVRRNGTYLAAQERQHRVLESVQSEPHFNTATRARRLGLSTRDVQAVLSGANLGHLNARLQFAGYQVEVLQPLAVARQRRIVASNPGSLIHADFKTFGVVRGELETQKRWIRGCIVIDSFTSFASVLLCPDSSTASAITALQKFFENAPFVPSGFILTDNGPAFTSEAWVRWVLTSGLMHRTTRSNHPWSNGKVEALNKTLKYQCFPAICTSEALESDTLQDLTDKWMVYYNSQRVHTGHMNRGLPPLALYALWRNAPGDNIEKIVHLGLISLDDLARIRYMGSSQRNAGEQRLRQMVSGADASVEVGQPLAFVIEGPEVTTFVEATRQMQPAVQSKFTMAR